MKGKMFLAHLNKAVASGSYNIKGLSGCKVLSTKGNTLRCEHDGKEFDFCVETIKASKASSGAMYDFLEEKSEQKVTKKKTSKKVKPITEDKE